MSELQDLVDEAQRQFTICNACRYCEDYCAVFPAMEERRLFTEGDLGYLATVCHDCRACYQACMYAEPHEFAINIPQLMSEGRVLTYERYAEPRWLARLFERARGTLVAAVVGAALAVALVFLLATSADSLLMGNEGPGSFYTVFPQAAMLAFGLLLAGWAILVCVVGALRFWRDIGGPTGGIRGPRLWRRAIGEAATLRWMRGGGGECHFPDAEEPSPLRRYTHAAVAAGFLLTFGATVAAAIEENIFGILPPYPLLSVPVILGTVGGVMVVLGCIGFLRMRREAPAGLAAPQTASLGLAFTWSLLVVAATGLALLALRETDLMGPLLLVHLAAVFAFFLTAPYGHLVHAVYRSVAIARNVQERASSEPGPEPRSEVQERDTALV
ncbi:MAG: tricarballylate utilization 4Fe-4S protein TcuB [Actinobacteria bacterium]|nr:tricarballylate utilization 4Fe-4S protein TcuB [Actinomycetota bacterium]